MVMNTKEFKQMFVYQPDETLRVQVERNAFILDLDGKLYPGAHTIMARAYDIADKDEVFDIRVVDIPVRFIPDTAIGYGFSPFQIKSQTTVCPVDQIRHSLKAVEKRLYSYMRLRPSQLGGGDAFTACYNEITGEAIPLCVTRDPVGHYDGLARTMSKEIISIHCQTLSTSVHLSMPDHETALAVYNKVIFASDWLYNQSDKSNGKRVRDLSEAMIEYSPNYYGSWTDIMDTLFSKQALRNPGRFYPFIRLTRHGTIEFRMFGGSSDIDEIVRWVDRCHMLCQEAMK